MTKNGKFCKYKNTLSTISDNMTKQMAKLEKLMLTDLQSREPGLAELEKVHEQQYLPKFHFSANLKDLYVESTQLCIKA